MSKINSEEAPTYGPLTPVIDNQVIAHALKILKSRLREPGEALTSPTAVKQFLTLKMAELEHEVFSVIFLDNRHKVITYEELFQGTIDGCAIPPREVVKAALRHNAAAVILAHNHPSGDPEPSEADKRITNRLKDALALIDVRVLDHIICAGVETLSFAEKGLV